MKAIIIGAGRGSRLKAMTDTQPKCYATVGGHRILDWTLEAFDDAGLREKVFIGGYQIAQIQRNYPQLTFAHNADWQNNNILLSLFLRNRSWPTGSSARTPTSSSATASFATR